MNRALNFLLLTAMFLTVATTAFCDTAEDFFNSGRAKQAKANLENVLNTDRHYRKEWERDAKAALDAAIADYSKAIELKPDFADAYYNRGLAEQAKAFTFGGRQGTTRSELDGAIADYSKAIELKPDFADAYYNRGKAKEFPADVENISGLRSPPGRGKEAKGERAAAIADYTKAIELKPDFADAYYNRGLAKWAEGDLDGARVDCTKGIELRHTKMRVNPKDGLTYVWIEPGTFWMGYYELPNGVVTTTHQVTFTKGFWIGQTVVTQEAYQRVTGANPSHFEGPKLPVEKVNVIESESYCQRVGMRLPTEAEWEYAARAGSTSGTQYGDIAQIKGDDDQPPGPSFFKTKKTAEVMQKLPNPWGLYDIFGNVFQFVSDSSVLGGTKWNRIGDYHLPTNEIVGVAATGNYVGFRCAGDFPGDLPVQDAVNAGDLVSVKSLLKDKPDLVSSKDSKGNTPLHVAAENGNNEVAELLLTKGADVNARNNDGATPLHLAALMGSKEFAELLLTNGADVNAKENDGRTPMAVARLYRRKDVAEFLHQHGGHN